MSKALWTPSSEYIQKSGLFNYQQFLESEKGRIFSSYHDLHQWSIDNLDEFWTSLLSYFDISYSGTYSQGVTLNSKSTDFIDTQWFEGIELSYAEHIFKQTTTERPALKFASESIGYEEVSWKELAEMVSRIQQFLIEKGVEKGDRVAAVLNNTTESIAIFLAVNSLGAIWSCCSPDFGDVSISERFTQIKPKVLFIETSYQYNERIFSKLDTLERLKADLVDLSAIVQVYEDDWKKIIFGYVPKNLTFVRVPFSHPIWILYSSGTTGKPKAITHSTGGNLLEHFKALVLHQNVLDGENFLWYTTTGWMMWNYALSSLLCGATLCLFDGIINHNKHLTFWTFLKRAKVDHLGAGAVYFSSLEGLEIKDYAPKVIGSTGSPLPVATFEDLQHKFPEVHIVSLSGGTDVCSAFLSGCPTLPVYAGMLQCRTLGSDIVAYNDEGIAVYDQVGELVIRKPMPSMPIYFWNDEQNIKYHDSYFANFSSVWSHGDWIKINEEGIVIYGRSDATLNRGGVRIGTAEIYNAVNSLADIEDSLVVCVDYENGTSSMLLFVRLENTASFTEELKDNIKRTLRGQYSPRHVPDFIYSVSDIPYTLSGKKLELPIKKIFSGTDVNKAVSTDIMRNPESLKDYVSIYKSI
ncbi:acetoacetyl-CoA synthetase [Sphingobacterium nematocida]|uniref:Acetoacetyl-CoA synthetase n=1 Tax=Sphingobacterium nematocida TaxID=1513896 RepID=A0A1T5DHI0_9SPHI|nr:acetoacetate--CoA ligase [Sphingobacterium nematocida]SKB71149.1 acetoacetyl-CoA synthetase [Sphingobacterium nematocida]